MSDPRDPLGEYVRQVGEATQRYAKSLLSENEKLLALATSLHHEKVRLETELETIRMSQTSLVGQLADLERSNRTFAEQYVEVEQTTSNLTNLYVASYRLHGSLERDAVLATIRDIVVNIIGSEEFAVLQVREGGALEVATSFGVEAGRFANASPEIGRIGAAVSRGERFVASQEDLAKATAEERLTACVPLKVGERVTGVIAIVNLLPHKGALEALDHEIFDLLATHAAMALYCAELHERHGARNDAHGAAA